MKKILSLLVMFLFIFIITGCGSKKLTCKIVTENGIKLTETISFKDNKLSGMSAIEVFTNKDDAQKAYEHYVEEGAYIVKRNGKKVTTKYTEESLEMARKLIKGSDFDYIKEDYISKGFTCK